MQVKVHFYILFISFWAYVTTMPLNEFKPRKRFGPNALKRKLNTYEFKVTQEGMNERAKCGEFVDFNEVGTYICIVCDEQKFTSMDKVVSFGKATFINPTGVVEVEKANKEKGRQVDLSPEKGTFLAAYCENCGSIMGEIKNEFPSLNKKQSQLNKLTGFGEEGKYHYPSGKKEKNFQINSAALKFIHEGEDSPRPPEMTFKRILRRFLNEF